MVARVVPEPEKRLSLGASSKPIFCQLNEVPVADRILLALLLDDGFAFGATMSAEALRTCFDSLTTRSLLQLTPLRETLLCKRAPVGFSGVRAFNRFIGRRLVSRLGAAIGSEATFVLRAFRWLTFLVEDRPRPESARTSSW